MPMGRWIYTTISSPSSEGLVSTYAHGCSSGTRPRKSGLLSVAWVKKDAYWRYPLLYGATERRRFMDYLQQIILNDSTYSQITEDEGIARLMELFQMSHDCFGIDVRQLFRELRYERGPKSGHVGAAHTAFCDFYGRLTPNNIREIVTRAVALVKEDPSNLDLQAEDFFHLLGVHPQSRGLLAEDILHFLDTMTIPAHSLNFKKDENSSPRGTLRDCKLLETKLKEFFATETYQSVLDMEDAYILSTIGETHKWTQIHLRRVRYRIMSEVYAHLFPAHIFDIRGEVTPEEARVVISRMISVLLLHNPKQKPHFTHRLLQQLRIHPCISGFDVDYVVDKIWYWRRNLDGPVALRRDIGQWASPLFTSKVLPWNYVASCVKSLVETHTMQVLKWSHEDLLAAMGMSVRVRVQPPYPTKRPHLFSSVLLPALFAQELRNRYGKGSPEEDKAIAEYLKKTFRYSIEDPSQRKAVEEARKNMMQNLNIEVTPEQRAKRELEETIEEFGLRVYEFRSLKLDRNEFHD